MMEPILESVLFCDPQAAPARPCPVCGGACYGPSWECIRCGRWEA